LRCRPGTNNFDHLSDASEAVPASPGTVDRQGNHRHFMAKEIHEQPEMVGHTLANYLDLALARIDLPMQLPMD